MGARQRRERHEKRRRSLEPSDVPSVKRARRDRGAERRAAREKEQAKLLADQEPKRAYEARTGVARGASTELFLEYSAKPPLVVVEQPVAAGQDKSAKRARAEAGARARWGGSREERGILPVPEQQRAWRQSESAGHRGTHRDYTKDELVFWCEAISEGRVKLTELNQLYVENKIRISRNIASRWIYGVQRRDPTTKQKIAGEWVVEPDAWMQLRDGAAFKQMGPVNQVILPEQEEFLAAVVCNFARRRKGLAPAELKRIAAKLAAQNGTLSDPESDVRGWYELFKKRMKREFGIDIEEMDTQQMSEQRSAVKLSDMRAFEELVNELLEDKPELAAEGLKAVGDWDEFKLDINAILQGAALVPAGQDAQWETEHERCPQITVLAGFVGHKRADKSAVLRSLRDVRERLQSLEDTDELDAQLDAELANVCKQLNEVGTVAG